MENKPTTKRRKPVIVGIIVDVSNSMRRNWKNQEGRSIPRIEIVRDTLNKQIKRIQSRETSKEKSQVPDLFCIGMGFRAPIRMQGMQFDQGNEKPVPNSVREEILSDLVCDLLALTEILPSESELEEFKLRLNERWVLYTAKIFDRATIHEEVNSRLADYIQSELRESALRRFRRGIIFRLHFWVSQRERTFHSHQYLGNWYEKLSVAVKQKVDRIDDISATTAPRYCGNILGNFTGAFTARKEYYTDLIQKSLLDFVRDYISFLLRALSLGFDVPELVAYFDEVKAIRVAEEIYSKLDSEVRSSTSGIWLANQKDLIWSRHQIGASLNLDAVRELTEKCIKKRGWEILKPLIEQTVLNMFVKEFEAQAKQQLPYWIRFSSTREVVRSLDQIHNLFPTVIENELYSDKVMFASTPFLDALDRASTRLLDKAYKNKEKVLVVISDGEFSDKQSSVLSAELLKHRGVKIISCLISEQNIVSRLVGRTEKSWPPGAHLLFEIASEITEDQVLNWQLPEDRAHAQVGKKLFYQINHSQILDDVIGAVFERPM